MSNGKIIIIHGASSAGKSTLAKAVQQAFPLPLLHISYDLFIDGDIVPWNRFRDKTFEWAEERPKVLNGFWHWWPILANAGNNIIIDHIIERDEDQVFLLDLLKGIDVYFVALHCSLEELEWREQQRGNRHKGDARSDLSFVHKGKIYDLELNSESSRVEENVATLIACWQGRKRPSAFEKMALNNVLVEGQL
jgi:chloramphenicol 3-O phosphotransferase